MKIFLVPKIIVSMNDSFLSVYVYLNVHFICLFITILSCCFVAIGVVFIIISILLSYDEMKTFTYYQTNKPNQTILENNNSSFQLKANIKYYHV